MGRRVDPREEASRLRAYWGTHGDREAAARLSRRPEGEPLTTGAFRFWRLSRGLPPRGKGGVYASERERRERIIREAPTFRKAAEEIGVSERGLRAFRSRGPASAPASDPAAPSSDAAPGPDEPPEATTALQADPAAGTPDAGEHDHRRLSGREQARRQEAYRTCATDSEAALQVGISRAAFTIWRMGRRLPTKSQRLRRFEEGRRLAAYEQARDDVAAGRLLGVAPTTFTSWRRARGLPAKRQPLVGPIEARDRLLAYLGADSDAQAAAQLGLRRSTFTAWRLKLHLPAGGAALLDGPSRERLRRRLLAADSPEALPAVLEAVLTRVVQGRGPLR